MTRLAAGEQEAGSDAESAPDAAIIDDPLFTPLEEPGQFGDGPPGQEGVRPRILGEAAAPAQEDFPALVPIVGEMFLIAPDVPTGFAGPSGVAPTEEQESSHFVPVEDRWRIGFPEWDRYAKGHPPVDDYPYVEGRVWDPYNLNVLKGDYPTVGQHTFLNVTGKVETFHEFRQLPTPTTPFESTVNPFEEEFFGNPNQYFNNTNFRLKLDLFHGNAAFKPVDWRIVVEPVFNLNYLKTYELGIVNPDVRDGTDRFREYLALEQYFVEAKLADLSPDYDFVSLRAGSQPFVSDFRGFIYADINRGIRLFGTRLANRDQFNVAVFDQLEKETNSMLNTFERREQLVLIANYFRQDFIFPGYTASASFHYNHDQPSVKFDRNEFLVRPDPAGVFQKHQVDACYFGFAGEGHIERVNIAHAFYWVRGSDSLNPLSGRPIDIDAKMAAVELSYDRDWVRFRASWFWASGDDDLFDDKGEGFDTILDNPNFLGGRFSFWQRQAIRLFGVNLVQRESLVPDLRSSKIQGQSNFVNPGVSIVNGGLDFEITPKTRLITNANYLWFDSTQVLEQFVFQNPIRKQIGVDLSAGFEYRPFLNDNVILVGGYSALIPGAGLDDLYGVTDPFHLFSTKDTRAHTMHSAFLELALVY